MLLARFSRHWEQDQGVRLTIKHPRPTTCDIGVASNLLIQFRRENEVLLFGRGGVGHDVGTGLERHRLDVAVKLIGREAVLLEVPDLVGVSGLVGPASDGGSVV